MPVMALSVSAPKSHPDSITESLTLNNSMIVHGSLNRPNILLVGVIKGIAVSLSTACIAHASVV